MKRVTGYLAVGENLEDARHPKVQVVVDEVLARWQRVEKSLIFCFRVPTAETMSRLLSLGVNERLQKARQLLLESRGTTLNDKLDEDKAMQQFRRSLTARDGNGISLFLDRVLLGWFQLQGLPQPVLTDEDCEAVARLYARARHQGATLLRRGDRLRGDRVFLNRAIEHCWAVRLRNEPKNWSVNASIPVVKETQELLKMLADESWVKFRYGREVLTRRKGITEADAVPTDSVAQSSMSAKYDFDENSD